MPDFNLENTINGNVCGLDEVGRGPLAGPVLAACVYVPEQSFPFLLDVNDSKKISPKKREHLYNEITQHCTYGIGQCTIEEIDDINILQASLLAMRRAYENMDMVCDHALIDGNKLAGLPCPMTTVIKGDSISISIAAASIIAKVTRDQIMNDLNIEYPEYGWNSNAGYGSKQHRNAIKVHGITPHHRKTFAPVRQMLEKEAS
jgi:ribonuclease HII